MTSCFQDGIGGRDVISCRKVLSPGESTMQQRRQFLIYSTFVLVIGKLTFSNCFMSYRIQAYFAYMLIRIYFVITCNNVNAMV